MCDAGFQASYHLSSLVSWTCEDQVYGLFWIGPGSGLVLFVKHQMYFYLW